MSYYLSGKLSHAVVGGVRGVRRMIWFMATFLMMAVTSVSLRAILPSGVHSRHGRAIRVWLGRRLARTAGVRVIRESNRPRGIAMVVSNHLSWLDSFVFLGEFGPCFVANRRWGDIPLLGTAMRATGVLFIERTRLRDIRAVGSAMQGLFDSGETTLVYPEADTSRGAAVANFRPGLLEPLAARSLPVGWAALRYETPSGWPPASVVVSWADWTPLLLHMYRAFHVPYITARIVYNRTPVTGVTRKSLAKELHRQVSAAFRPQEQLSDIDLMKIFVPPPGPLAKY